MLVLAMNGGMCVTLPAKGSTTDGQIWDDGKWEQVKQIFIWHQKDVGFINSIQTTYKHQGTSLLSPRRGGVGEKFEVVTLNEPLLWVSGTCQKDCNLDDDGTIEGMWHKINTLVERSYLPSVPMTITSLKFGTARATYGPFGKARGESFTFNSTDGISGFHGRIDDRDGGFLNAIGVHFKSMATGRTDQIHVRGGQH